MRAIIFSSILFLALPSAASALNIDPEATSLSTQVTTSNSQVLDLEYNNLRTINIDTDAEPTITHLVLSGNFPVLHSITIEGTHKKFNGEFVGSFPNLTNVDIQATSGKTMLDLNGIWVRDANINVVSTSGEVRLRLPQDMGVQIQVNKTSGTIYNNYTGESWGTNFKNSLYKKTKTNLNITIHVTSGNVYLQ